MAAKRRISARYSSAAYKTGIAPLSVCLEHVPFGTMNGKDNKPFKTREGGVLRLKDLIKMTADKAMEELAGIETDESFTQGEKERVSSIVGVAALKFADLINHRTKDYIFDIDRFTSFEGRTGPYMLYTIARIKSIVRKSLARGLVSGPPFAASQRL